jgi:hypothetical protein
MPFKNQGNVVPILKQTAHNQNVWGIGDIAPRILSPGIRWRWAVSFMTRSPYYRGLSSRSPLARRLHGPQTRNVRRKMTDVLFWIVWNCAVCVLIVKDYNSIGICHGYRNMLVVSYRQDVRSYNLISKKQKQWLSEERNIESDVVIEREITEQVGTTLSSWIWCLVWLKFTDAPENVLRAYSGTYTFLPWRCGQPQNYTCHVSYQ